METRKIRIKSFLTKQEAIDCDNWRMVVSEMGQADNGLKAVGIGCIVCKNKECSRGTVDDAE